MELISIVGRLKGQWQRRLHAIAAAHEELNARYEQAFERLNYPQGLDPDYELAVIQVRNGLERLNNAEELRRIRYLLDFQGTLFKFIHLFIFSYIEQEY